MIAVIEDKKQEIFNQAEHQTQQCLEHFRKQRIDIEHKVKIIVTTAEKSETLLEHEVQIQSMQS